MNNEFKLQNYTERLKLQKRLATTYQASENEALLNQALALIHYYEQEVERLMSAPTQNKKSLLKKLIERFYKR